MTMGSGRFGWILVLGAAAALAACGNTVEESAATGGLGGAAGAAAGSGVEIGQQQGQLPPEPGAAGKPEWRASEAPPADTAESRNMGALPPRWEQR